MAKLHVQQSADGTMIADVSVNEYLEHKREYLHESDCLKISGQVKSEDLAGLFQYKDRLSKSRVKALDITGLIADEPALSVAGMFKNNRNLEEIRGLGSLVCAVENSKDMQEISQCILVNRRNTHGRKTVRRNRPSDRSHNVPVYPQATF